MVPVNIAAVFTAIPSWFKHAPADGLTLPDFVVPLFLFSLGLSASFSFTTRMRERGFWKTLLHSLARSAVLFAFGSIGVLFVDHSTRWEILQMLGATGLFSFFFLLVPPWPRLGAAVLLLAGVEILRPLGLGSLLQAWYDTGIGGPWGTFSLSFFVITASALGEIVKDASTGQRFVGAALLAGVLCSGGLAARLFVPFSKHLLSLSYVLFTAGVSSSFLAILVLALEIWGVKPPVIGSMGRNALFLYMLHAVLGVGVQAVLGPGTGVGLAWGVSFLVLGACAAAAVVMDRKGLHIKL